MTREINQNEGMSDKEIHNTSQCLVSMRGEWEGFFTSVPRSFFLILIISPVLLSFISTLFPESVSCAWFLTGDMFSVLQP